MRRVVTVICICLLVSASSLLFLQRRAWFRVSPAAGHADAITVDSAQRTYWLYVPPNFHSGALLVALHGSGATGRQMAERTGLNTTAADHGFAVVYPDALEAAGLTQWNGYFGRGVFNDHPPDDVAFVRALLSKLHSEIAFDPNRVYVVGGSNGGLMANRVGIELANKIAAIGVVSGSLYAFGGNTTALPRPVEPLSVIMLHGDSDDLVPYCAGPAVASQEQAFSFWSEASHCRRLEPAMPLCGPNGTITSITAKSATGCDAGVEVQFYRLFGGVHSWHQRPMNIPESTPYNPQLNEDTGTNTNEILWRFFARHSKSVQK